MATPLWRLHGSTNKVLECFLELKSPTLYAVTIVFADETFLNESYPDRASATMRAMNVRERLLKTGDWTMGSTVATDLSNSVARRGHR